MTKINNTISNKDFQSFIWKTLRKFSTSQIAIGFGCSVPTVERWAKGVSSPHPNMRAVVVKHLEEMIQNEAKSK